jgi:hypothetical protein
MTLLGKILVIVNLLLSVAVGALIVMTYVARTNWHHAWKDLDTQMKAYQANTTAAQGNTEVVQKDLDAARVAQKKAEADRDQAIDQGKNAVAARDQKISGLEKAVGDRDNLLTINQGQLESRQKEVAYLRDLAKDLQVKLRDKEHEAEEYHKVATDHEIARAQEHNRNEQLLRLLEQRERELQQERNKSLVVGNGSYQHNPPKEDVDGLVKAVDPDTGLLTLTIGSDAGLNKGNTMEVYRLRPEPTYLGTIQIIAARPNEAVARPLNRTRTPIKVGDTVSTNILTKR